MANTSFKGPIRSKNGFKWIDDQELQLYWSRVIGVNLEFGAGPVDGSLVALSIDPSGNVTVTGLASYQTVVEAGLIAQENDTGSVELTGSDSAAEGGNIKLWGSAAVGQENDIQLRSGSSPILSWDDSANGLILGRDATSNAYLRGQFLQYNFQATSALEYIISSGVGDGGLVISAGTSSSSGANLRLLGATHGSEANDWSIRADSTSTLAYDHSAATITANIPLNINIASTPRFSFTATTMTVRPGSAGTANILSDVSNGLIVIAPDTTGVLGGNIRLWGSTHGSAAGDFALRDNGTRVISFDKSAQGLFLGTDATSPNTYVINNLSPQLMVSDTLAFGSGARPMIRWGASSGGSFGAEMVLDTDNHLYITNVRSGGATLFASLSGFNVEFAAGGDVNMFRGNLDISRSSTGNIGVNISNSGTNANSHSRVHLQVDSTGGDPYIDFIVPSVRTYRWGMDNSDADIFKLASGIGSAALGSDDIVRITNGGSMRIAGGFGVGNSAAATLPGTVVAKVEIFDFSGVSLGFIPVYDTIT